MADNSLKNNGVSPVEADSYVELEKGWQGKESSTGSSRKVQNSPLSTVTGLALEWVCLLTSLQL